MILFRFYTLRRLGYYRKEKSAHRFPFLAGANIAFRRTCLDEVGVFDPGMQLGEDSDLTMRVLLSDWEIFTNDDALSYHRTTYGLRDFLTKWFRHGYYTALFYRKYHLPALELFRRRKDPQTDQSSFKCIYYRARFPFRCLVFIDSFLLAHLFGLGAIVLPQTPVRILSLTLGALFLVRYLRKDVGAGPLDAVLRSMFLRYAWNAMQVAGGLYGGIRTRSLVVNATI